MLVLSMSYVLVEKYHRWVNVDFMLEKCLVQTMKTDVSYESIYHYIDTNCKQIFSFCHFINPAFNNYNELCTGGIARG